MRLQRVILRVTDMERSVAFWSGEFGLDVTFSGGSFTFLDGGGTQLVLNEVDALPDDTSQTEIVFEVEDVIATHAEMSDRGVTFEVELRAVTSNGGQDLLAAHFLDPDGHLSSLTGWVNSD